jgi:pimeloyl-ACP methyl ester carboxylesterase/protein-tyrosine phosphatase
MAALSRRNGSTFVICAFVVVWLSTVVCAGSDRSATIAGTPSQTTADAVKVLIMRDRWLQLDRYSLLELLQRRGVSMLRLFTASNLVKLAPLLIPCIWLVKKWTWVRSSDSTLEDGPDISDTIGIGKLVLARLETLFLTIRPDAIATDPGLLKKHSTYETYRVAETGVIYPSIRTFYRPHPQGDKLPSTPNPIPLLVFIHGLGGSVAQFHPLLSSLVNVAPCLAIDLPGCGLSRFAPKTWEAYTPDSLVRLLAVIIEKHRDVDRGQGVVLVCHSMGCSLGALLASSTSPHVDLISEHVLGLIGICPAAQPPGPKQAASFRKLLWIPGPIFDLWRRWDRRGGTKSASVARFTGFDAEEGTKKLQVRFNEQSRTPVWRRMASGLLPEYSTSGAQGGMPGRDVWSGLVVPLYLLAGEADTVTPAENIEKIARFLGHQEKIEGNDYEVSSMALLAEKGYHPTELANGPHAVSTTQQRGDILKERVFKATILPSPAGHALLYAQRTARPISAHIQTFLASHVDHRLSLGWQLQHLTTEGKWDVKNFQKWQAIAPVSLPIANGVFRAMKTLREIDESHSPKVFVKEWAISATDVKGVSIANTGKDGLGAIAVVVDISHESPVYDPRGLENGGIEYRKFPTVSKLPPTIDEVKHFIDIIDGLRTELHLDRDTVDSSPRAVVAVHCHYGFNRTGFFIVAYMVERLGWTLKDALREFKDKRPPGVRHSHFVDELCGRYWNREDG